MVIKKAVRVKLFFAKNTYPQTIAAKMSPIAQAISILSLGFFSLSNAAAEELPEPADFKFPEFKSCSLAPQPVNTGASNPFADTSSRQLKQGYIHAWSDTSYSEANKAYLEGKVIIQQGDHIIKADKLIADNETKTYQTEGELIFSSPDVIVKADSMVYQELEGSSQIQNSQFFLYGNNGNGTAEQITIDNKQLLTLQDTDFSTCPEDQRSWAFESGKIIIDKESGWGKAYNSVVKVANIPVFYLPYMTFPVDDRRKTGLLPPSFSNSSRNGADIRMPYYFNLAPNYDLTLVPRYMSKRGAGLETEFRYLMPSYAGELNFSYLPEDDLAAENPELDTDRWSYSIKHHNQFSDAWSANVDAQKVSDDAYFQDFGGGVNNSNQATLSQNLYLQYLTQDWHFKTQYQDWQLLNSVNHRYKIAPRIEATRFFLGDSYYARIRSEATRFEHKNPTQIDFAYRYHLEPTVGWNFERLYGFIRPQLSYALTQYQQTDINGNKQTFDRALPTVSLDSGLFFERPWSFGGKDFTHTFEPRAFYLYTPYEDQRGIGLFDTSLPSFNFTQLFNRNRFAGIDRIGDANQISGAITSRLIDQQGKERLSFTLGRTVYLQDRKVQLLDSTPRQTARQSGLLAELNWRWNEQLEIKGAIDWDDQQSLTTSGSFLLHYEPADNHIINLGHRFRRNFGRKIEEAEVAFAWPIKENWRFLSRYSRDLSQNRTNESFFGLEYESCCWAVRLVNRRYLNIQLDNQGNLLSGQGDLHNSGVFVQFVLKGIGSLRGSTTEFLEESIYGYQDRLGK